MSNYENSASKDNKKADFEELFFQMKINTREKLRSEEKGTFLIEQKAEEQKRAALQEQTGQEFKIEELENWIEKNRKATEEKKWSVYREQKTQQLERKRQENEARWVKKHEFDEEERWARCQKIVRHIERENELRQAEQCRVGDEKRWADYRKQMIEQIDREEAKALKHDMERRAEEEKWWDKFKKQMLKQKEEEEARWAETIRRVGEEEVLAEFQELVQSKQAKMFTAEEKNPKPEYQYLLLQTDLELKRKKLKGHSAEGGKSWADYRKQLIEQMKREEVKEFKAEKMRRFEEDKWWDDFNKMVAQKEKEMKERLAGAAKMAALEEVLSEYQELVERKKE